MWSETRTPYAARASWVQPRFSMPLDAHDLARLRDMVVWSRKAAAILGDCSFDELMGLEEKRLALVRCIEVIGEAGQKVSPVAKSALSAVPWPAMYGMRNRLIHDYGNTNYEVVYDVVTGDLPGLAAIIADFLVQHGQDIS
ncbi:MAG: DUF86 domain-containing protein [Planctomycetota bacterium]|nr:MAG: DUF86 domain-containing protein [Planctomycetota bacterium]